MRIGASLGGRGTPMSKKVRDGWGKGKGNGDVDDDAHLMGVADSPGSWAGDNGDDVDGWGMVGMGKWKY